MSSDISNAEKLGANPFKMKIPDYVRAVMDVLSHNGFEVYAVGGCVRDSLLLKEPHDFDLTTSANPQQMKEAFCGFSVIETGISHGTLTVRSGGQNVEVTTFRTDGKYTDHRRPDSVSFTTSLKEDLSRRDFTVNALAYNDESGLVDLFGGQDDLEKRIVRCVGEPDRRFEEDALRILRALRFSAKLGFSIEQKTAQSMIKKRELLKSISAERVLSELSGILCGKGQTVTKLLLQFRDVFATVLPELSPCFDFDQKNPYHSYDVYTHIAYTVGFTNPRRETRFAALLHDVGKPLTFFTDEKGVGHFFGHPKVSADMAKTALKRLKADNRLCKSVDTLVFYHDNDISEKKASVKKMLIKTGEQEFFALCDLKKADRLAHSEGHRDISDIEAVERTAREILKENECLSKAQLKVSGRDLIALGQKPGKRIGEILDEIFESAVNGRVENDRESLLNLAKGIIERDRR